MANGDNLADLIDLARREMPDIPPDVWHRFTVLASLNFGASKIYIPSQKKRHHLQTIEAMAAQNEAESADAIAKLLGISVRHARRLKRMR